MKRLKYIVGTGICALALLAGAYSLSTNQNINVDTVSGIYQASDEHLVSQLTLSKDGSYIHTLHTNTSSCSHAGTWRIDDRAGDIAVVLTNANFIDLGGKISNSCNGIGGIYMLQVSRFLGTMRLIYDIDLGLAYTKNRSSGEQ